jgi:hypothetical protein
MAVTTTKGVIKMPAEGDAVTMHVAKCEVVEGQFGEQVKFTDTRGDALFLPRASADRQLARIGFADQEMVLYGDVDGNTLAFVRAHNDKMPAKPFWNIERITPEDAATRPSLAAQAKAEAERVRKAKGLPADNEMNIGKLPFDDEIPPPTDDDMPPSNPIYDDEDGLPPVKQPEKMGHPTKETAYFALAERVLAWQVKHGKTHGVEVTMASVNAMTFSIYGLR